MDLDMIKGASGAIPRNDLARMDAHAERFYEEIRRRNSDIEIIARNTGHSVEAISSIKEHVFFDEHALGDDVPERFSPDYDMAVSWQRLISGDDIREMDLVLLRHEQMELGLMRRGIPYFEAHKQAEAVHNYTKYVKQLNEEAEL